MEIRLEEVSLELSNRCLGRCLHCSSDSSADADTLFELALDEWLSVVNQAKDLGADVVSLSGGEPLLYPHWKSIVEAIVDLGMDVLFYTCGIKETAVCGSGESIMVTRGMSEEDLDFLKEEFDSGWGRIIFSLEGTDAVTHDTIVGVIGSYMNTINSVQRAIDRDISVELHFTPMDMNWHQVTSFLSYAKQANVDKVSFLRLVPQGRAKVNAEKVMYSPRVFHLLQKDLYGWSGKPDFRIGCPLSFGHLYGYVEQRPRCHAGLDLLLVRPTGDVHSCAGWKECKSLVAGNVRNELLRDIWESSDALSMVRDFHRSDAAAGFCRRCPWKSCCGGGCPAQRIIYNQQFALGLELDGLSVPAAKAIATRENWQLLVDGVDPMCPRFNGILKDREIIEARKNAGIHREQDDHGNIIK